jgi:hypothetical protein
LREKTADEMKKKIVFLLSRKFFHSSSQCCCCCARVYNNEKLLLDRLHVTSNQYPIYCLSISIEHTDYQLLALTHIFSFSFTLFFSHNEKENLNCQTNEQRESLCEKSHPPTMMKTSTFSLNNIIFANRKLENVCHQHNIMTF